ncbi:MAG: RidA family protein [Rhodospirillales bacterium]
MSEPTFHTLTAAPKPVAPFSHAVEADGWVQLTGQVPTDPADDGKPLPDGIEAQTRRVMDNLVLVLAELGLGLEHVISARVFVTDFERDYAAMNEAYASYFPADRRPARTCVGVRALARGALVEIDMVARRP